MGPANRLIVRVSDDLDALLDDLARGLREPSSRTDPFVAETIVYPNAGVRDYITRGLADRLGIAANFRFQGLGSFVASVLAGRKSDENGGVADWSTIGLTWVIHETLLGIRDGRISGIEVPGLAVNVGHVDDGGVRSHRGESTWAIARRIADLFDHYAFQRPTLVESWAGLREEDLSERSLLQPTHEWQPKLWRIIDERIRELNPEARNPAEIRREGLLALREGRLLDSVPHRVSIVGMSALPPSVYEVLSTLAIHREVRVFMSHPSRTWWEKTPPKSVLDPTFDDREIEASTNHPLLRSWGQSSLASGALVKGRSEIDCKWLPSPSRNSETPDDLLGHLRESLRRGSLQAIPGAVADDSLQLHACHGASRQVEVLREALVRTFVDFDGSERLESREVLIVCPDIERFAPLVEAILGQGAIRIGAVISDRTITSENLIVSALMALIDAATGRANVDDLLSLIRMEPIRMRFGWSLEEVDELADLCIELGVRWGLNGGRRGGPVGLEDGSWRWIADQMLLGIADDAPMRRRRFAAVPPADGVSSTRVSTVGSFGVLVARLEELNEWIFSSYGGSPGMTAKPAEQWWERLRDTLVDLLADVKGASFGHAKLLARFDQLWGIAATSGVELTLEDVKSILASLPNSSPGRLRLRSGKVTVTSMLPNAGVPSDVVCILGFDEAASRLPGTDGDDILGHDPRIGDRNGRNEHRQLLLDAVRSARRRLIVTYDGFDVSSNDEVKPVVALQEFVEVVETILPDVTKDAGSVGDGAEFVSKRKCFGLKHPRHGFNERYFLPGLIDGTTRVFSHDRKAREAAEAKRRVGEFGQSTSWWLSVGGDATEFTIDQLADALTNPSKVYLKDRLEISLPEEPVVPDAAIPIELPPLVQASLSRELLEILRKRIAGDENSWRESAELHPDCPPGVIGEAALDVLEEKVKEFMGAILGLGGTSIDPMEDLSIPVVGASTWLVGRQAVPTAGDSGAKSLDEYTSVRSGDDDSPASSPPSEGASRSKTTACGVNRVVGSIDELMTDGSTLRLVVARYVRPKNSLLLSTALRLAALVVDGRWRADHEGIEAVVLTRAGTRSEFETKALRPKSEDIVAKAQVFIERACELRCHALQDAIPFFDGWSRKVWEGLATVDRTDSEQVRECIIKLVDDDDDFLEKELEYDRYRSRHWRGVDLREDLISDDSQTLAWALRIWDAYFDFVDEEKVKS